MSGNRCIKLPCFEEWLDLTKEVSAYHTQVSVQARQRDLQMFTMSSFLGFAIVVQSDTDPVSSARCSGKLSCDTVRYTCQLSISLRVTRFFTIWVYCTATAYATRHRNR